MDVLVLTGAGQWSRGRFETKAWSPYGVELRPSLEPIPDEVEILVISPGVREPLACARLFRQRKPAAQILFVVTEDQLDRFRRLLPFAPKLSGAWVVNADVGDADLKRFVDDGVAAVERRRAVKGLYGRINARFAASADGDERASGQVSSREHAALAERYLSAILADAPDALIAVALDGAIVSWNEAARRLFRVGWDDVAGSGFSSLFLAEDQTTARDLLERAGLGESVRSVELRVGSNTGNRIFELSAGPVLGGGGAIEGVSLIARDVTGRRQDEAALRSLNDDLESRVAQGVADYERTAAALRQAQKMEAVGQLTGGVAHDFNNLLTIMKSSLDLLGRPNLSDERRARYFDAMSTTVDRAAKLTAQLLAFSRRQHLKPEVFDIVARVRTIAELLRPTLGGHVAIAIETDQPSGFVNADVSQFETALINLAVNARDAMKGAGELRITLRQVGAVPTIRGHAGAAGNFVAVSMSDTGAGIGEETIGQIFEPFFTTKGVGEGSGLGLSQVFGFAKQSGGDIDVQSALGKGATFTLFLPQVVHDHGRPAESDMAAGAGSERRLAVLVVEDNIQVGTFATQVLEDIGHTVTLASNAEEALRILERQRERYDVVFSDVVMPGMSGLDLGLRIRALYRDLPVILTSGYSHILAQEGRHGFEVVQKPYGVSDVASAFEKLARD